MCITQFYNGFKDSEALMDCHMIENSSPGVMPFGLSVCPWTVKLGLKCHLMKSMIVCFDLRFYVFPVPPPSPPPSAN